jgi:hypothetical protein
VANRQGSIGTASVWMFILSILLFWLPIVGPLVAGFVGGRKAGGLGNAIIAAFIPAIVFGVALFFLATLLTGFPLLAFAASAGGFALATAHIGPLLLGAILGAML